MVRLKILNTVRLAGSFMQSGSDSFKVHFIKNIVYAPIEKSIIGKNNIISQNAVNYALLPSCKGTWFMNCVGTPELDRSSNNSNLFSVGSSRFNTSLPTDFTGYYRTFNGTTDYMSAADNGTTDIKGSSAKLTIFARIKIISVGSSKVYIASKWGLIGSFQYSLILYNSGGQKVRLAISPDGTSQVTVTGNSTISTDQWVSIAGVYDGVDMRVYLNGALNSTPVPHTTGIYNSASDFYVGLMSQLSGGFNGNIYELGIWNDALTAQQILEIHNAGIIGNNGDSE